jgi:hypothetical protein
MGKPVTITEVLVVIIGVGVINLGVTFYARNAQSKTSYPPMCFVSGTTDTTGYAPATWIEREGLKNLVQKFVMYDCLDGKQFVAPWVKQGGAAVKDTR